MSIEAVAAAVAPVETNVQTVQAGFGAGVSDVTSFSGSMHAAGANAANAPQAAGAVEGVGATPDVSPAMKAMFNQLEKVNGEAKSVSDYAKTAQASGGTMTPGEIVQLTVRCQEFMFHCQLTSNIANRTSDGVQQLFRQQS